MRSTSSLERVGGTIAGRYRVEQMLGRGGMAAVYRVRDTRSGKQLAIKRCWARDPNKLQRHGALLEREYHTLAQLAHPRIIEVYDYGVDARGPYYTMELLEGADLEKVERVPWQQACAVLCDVASSLAILHSRGLVHRDVSTRNVHYGSDGHVKLIDFGAMASMGVAKDTVGTPPFMAPEVLQLQALDARVDLFSLGALGYRLLTGRHAYPARRLADLRDAWRSKPPPPAAIVPEIPSEVSALILRLLTLDRGGRPQTAAEVIDRLRKLAGLPADDSAEISRAYLTTPTLVGRDAALLEVRRRMLSLVRGDGGLMLVRGEAGSGRSRLLDACALEGKLLGATIVRADARDASNGDWGVAKALGNQLLELFPEQAAEAARLTRNVLGHLFESLRSEELYTATGFAPERSVLIRELREWIFSLAKLQRLLIIVDDAERMDDPSSALLSALAHRADRHALLLALSLERGARVVAGPVRLLEELGQPIDIEDLQPQETEALIRSVFGDVPNLSLCAARIHGLCHGNPRAAMALAQHLVDTKRARYEAGVWALPGVLDERDLPSTLAASLSARLEELSPDARELASALALADEDALHLGVYPALTEHADPKRVFGALDELVAARILLADAERYTFAQRGVLAVLCDSLSDEARTAFHLRIARMLATRGGDVLRRAHHLLAADLDADAVTLLCRADLQGLFPSMALLKRAIAAAERLELPASTLHRLRMTLLVHAPLTMDYRGFRDVAAIVLKQLEQDTGLARYRELGHLPANERLSQALAQAQQAYVATPESERVYTVIEAVRELARLYGAIPAMASTVFDLELLESLPALDPLFPLSPTLPVVAQLVEACKEWVRGRLLQAKAIHESILVRISEPDRAGFDDAQYERTRLGIEYTVGLLEATQGIEGAEKRAHLLEGQRTLRVNAWRIRSFLQLAIGNVTESRKCARRSELLEAQEGLRERYPGSSVGMELALYSRLGDLLGVKGSLERLTLLASQHRGWQPVELLGRSRYSELQGDFETALVHVEKGLSVMPPLRHPFFVGLAATHVHALLSLGRVDEAMQRGREYARVCDEHELAAPDLYLHAALALGRGGHYSEALAMLEPTIARAEQLERTGLGLGVLYEARAKLAIGMQDRPTFDLYAQRCAAEYQKSRNPALGARLARLFEAAQEAGVRSEDASFNALHAASPSTEQESEHESVHSRIAECVDGSDRARCALTLLLQTTFSTTGYLYALDAQRHVTLLAALPDVPSDLGLVQWVEQHAQAWLNPEDSEETTATGVISSVSDTADGRNGSVPQRYNDCDGRTLELVLLLDEREGQRSLSGVLVLQTAPAQRVFPPRHLCATIARELLDHGDANAWSS